MNSAQKAFTLIELLIVVSLITVITGTVLPSFNNYMKNQSTRQAFEQVKDDLRTTQNRALNGENSTALVNGIAPEYWFVEFLQDQNTYKFYYSNTNSNVCNNPTSLNRTYVSSSGQLPGGNVVRSSNECIFFSFENGDASYSSGGAGNNQVIVGPPATASTGCKRVQIETNGFIYLVAANISCS